MPVCQLLIPWSHSHLCVSVYTPAIIEVEMAGWWHRLHFVKMYSSPSLILWSCTLPSISIHPVESEVWGQQCKSQPVRTLLCQSPVPWSQSSSMWAVIFQLSSNCRFFHWHEGTDHNISFIYEHIYSTSFQASGLILVLPNKLIQHILDYLGVDDLSKCSTVSILFREFPGQLILPAMGLWPNGWLSVSSKHYQALLMWRQLSLYVAPRNIYFNVTQDYDLHVLDVFLQTPEVVNHTSIFLNCNGDALLTTLIAQTIESVMMSGYSQVSLSHFSPTPPAVMHILPKTFNTHLNYLYVFSTNTPLAFSSEIAPFSMTVLHHAPLHWLSLQNTGLTSGMWSKLLPLLDCLICLSWNLTVSVHPKLCWSSWTIIHPSNLFLSPLTNFQSGCIVGNIF